MLVYRTVNFPRWNTFHPPHEPLRRSCGLLMTREGKTCCCWFGWPGFYTLHTEWNRLNEYPLRKWTWNFICQPSIFSLKSRLILPLKCYLGLGPTPTQDASHLFPNYDTCLGSGIPIHTRVFSPWHPGSGKAIPLQRNTKLKTAVTS